MSQFLESIHVQNKIAPYLSYHQKRYETCMRNHYSNPKILSLANLLKHAPTDKIIYKLRIEYSDTDFSFKYIPYKKREIKHLHIINCDTIKYQWKYSKRDQLSELKKGIPKDSDIIIIRNNFVTDSSYSNLVFEKNKTYYTPSTPLLEGVMRTHLLKEGIIISREIEQKDLINFDRIYLINAMMDMKSGINLPTTCIKG